MQAHRTAARSTAGEKPGEAAKRRAVSGGPEPLTGREPYANNGLTIKRCDASPSVGAALGSGSCCEASH